MKNITNIVIKTISFVIFVFTFFLFPGNVFADQYGQEGVILGEAAQTEIVHSTVDAGITETVLYTGIFSVILSLIFFRIYNKLNKVQA